MVLLNDALRFQTKGLLAPLKAGLKTERWRFEPIQRSVWVLH